MLLLPYKFCMLLLPCNVVVSRRSWVGDLRSSINAMSIHKVASHACVFRQHLLNHVRHYIAHVYCNVTLVVNFYYVIVNSCAVIFLNKFFFNSR